MIFKSLLPFENYVLTTRLSLEDVRHRIAENIQPKQRFKFSLFYPDYTKPYTGSAIGSIFTMRRNITYRNSFLPIITGKITTSGGQTKVNIKMQPDTVDLVFISLWLGIVGFFCLAGFLSGLMDFRQTTKTGFSPPTLIPFGMFAFACLLTILGFKLKSRRSKKFLARLLESTDQ